MIGTNLLTKFHYDRKINVASRVLTRFYYSHIWINAPPPGSHVFQPTVIIFELVQDIIEMNLLTTFHEDRTVNVASRVKNAPPLGSHVFQSNITIFELIQNINKKNLLTKFQDWTINVASRVKNAQLLGSHVFLAKVTIFELIQDIIGTNLLSKFHEDRKINVASRVLTRKNALSPGGHVFQPTGIIFELIEDIIRMNLLAKFHEDQTINVASRVLTRFYYSHIRKNAPPLGSHVFQANVTMFELIQDIIETNLLTKFHEDWTINVPSRELTRQMLTPHNEQKAITKAHHEHNHEHAQNTIGTNLLTKKNAPPTGGNVFQPTGIIFKLVQDIIWMNLLTKFHEDQTINVASRVLTRFYYSHTRKNAPPLGSHNFQANRVDNANVDGARRTKSDHKSHIRKNAPPLGSHVYQANVTIFELIQDIIETNLLTKFHED
ncbi:hypothetical protein DPMN_175894 [Dreissena polymorpha]|uniref:Uncharacterized protein n=1 Tax=Dreissena polymorpha TaxID=45954 RepID=A0A9D4EA90_DREPO|nr:hypothetical protein DPMN_175894 [Dreissena polymorpha]